MSDLLTLEDAWPVIRQAISPNTILVGGQSVNLWSYLLQVDPTSSYLTDDIDLIGSREDALKADKAMTISHKLTLARQDDNTINSAVIQFVVAKGSKPRVIDYLVSLYGLDRDEIEKHAVSVEYEGTTFKVIHPIHLLESKISNLSLASKRSKEGLTQAELAIHIVNAFIETTMSDPDVKPRSVLKMIRRVITFAKNEHALNAYKDHGLDVLKAIPIDALKHSTDVELVNFVNKGIDNDQRQVDKFRKISKP